MRTGIKYILAVLILTAFSGFGATATAEMVEEPAFVKVFVTDWQTINLMIRQGFYVDTCKAPDDDGIFVYADTSEKSRLTEYGYQYEVLHSKANYAVEPVAGTLYKNGKATYDHYFNGVEQANILASVAATLNAKVPNTAEVINIGTSVDGRDLAGIKISDNVDTEEDEPEVRLLGTHHGNEMISYMVLLYFLEELADKYNEAGYESYTQFVNELELWCVPTVNPDGVATGFNDYDNVNGVRNGNGTRRNSNNVDLNRDYSYHWDGDGGSPSPFSQPETKAVRDNGLANHFSISHTYHSGVYYINYVWNYKSESDGDAPPNRDFIFEMCEIYDDYTDYTITNGGDWYETNGDTNDWSYGEVGNIDTTIELHPGSGPYSHDPRESDIIDECTKNVGAILETLLTPLDYGVRGVVYDTQANQNPIAEATIWVEDLPGSSPSESEWFVFNDDVVGDYHFLLLPGTYDGRCEVDGYTDVEFTFTVPATGSLAFVDIYMEEGTADTGDDGPATPAVFSLTQNRPNPSNNTTTISFSLPQTGYTTLDMFDISGRKVMSPLNGVARKGENSVDVDISSLSSGVYIYRLSSGNESATKKMIVR